MALKKISFEEAIEDSKNCKKRHLVIGNGFSISARPNIFTYGSLFNVSEIPDDPRLSSVFASLGLTDFEAAIRSLEQSSELVPVYVNDYEDAQNQMKVDATRIKDILIDTVARNHPDGPFDMKPEEFGSCQVFLANFLAGPSSGLVFTVNYDLLLYWTLMHIPVGETRPSLRVDDGFGNDEDDPYADYVVWHGETRAHTPSVFYLHGALHLFDHKGMLQKFTWVRTGERLKIQARKEMDNGKFPLFVSEGTSDQKFDRVRHNAYLYQGLKTFYANASQEKHCFFIHGHSLAENDNHIFNLIGRGKCQKIYVSVHGELDQHSELVANVRRIQALRGISRPLEVAFYDAVSAHVWDRHELA